MPRLNGGAARANPTGRDPMPLLWILVIILIILAVGGGVAVHNLLWLLLIVALVIALFSLLSGRRAV